MTTIETVGADVHAAAAMRDTDRAVLRMITGADDLRVLETLVDECLQEEGAGAVRMNDTGRGLGESPEGDLDHTPDLQPHERTSTRLHLPITLRKRCDGHAPRPAPDPGRYRDHTLVHVLAPDPGPDASQEDARNNPLSNLHSVIWTQVGHLSREDLFVLT